MFYGWRVVAGAFVGMAITNGLFTYGFTVLVDPIRVAFAASLEQVMYSMTLGTLLGLLVAPLVGVLIDRQSVRLIMILGCLVLVAGLYAASRAQGITAFNLSIGVTMSVSMAMAGSMAGSAAVARWFTASRGKALGIAAMGSSLGGVVVPALLTFWVERHGWRGALEYLALCAAGLVLPFICWSVRSRPQDVGLQPEGISAADSAAQGAQLAGPGLAQIVRMRAFWLIGLSMGMVFAAFSSMLANLAPYAARLGVGEGAISTLIAVLAVAGLVGKLLFGTAADRINLKFGLWGAHALLGIAFAILLVEPGYAWLLLAATCFGLSTGGMLPVWNAMVARVFGIASFGRAMGVMGPVIALCVMPGFAVVGRLFDATGSYSAGLWLFGAVIGLAAALLLPLKIEAHTAHPA